MMKERIHFSEQASLLKRRLNKLYLGLTEEEKQVVLSQLLRKKYLQRYGGDLVSRQVMVLMRHLW